MKNKIILFLVCIYILFNTSISLAVLNPLKKYIELEILDTKECSQTEEEINKNIEILDDIEIEMFKEGISFFLNLYGLPINSLSYDRVTFVGNRIAGGHTIYKAYIKDKNGDDIWNSIESESIETIIHLVKEALIGYGIKPEVLPIVSAVKDFMDLSLIFWDYSFQFSELGGIVSYLSIVDDSKRSQKNNCNYDPDIFYIKSDEDEAKIKIRFSAWSSLNCLTKFYILVMEADDDCDYLFSVFDIRDEHTTWYYFDESLYKFLASGSVNLLPGKYTFQVVPSYLGQDFGNFNLSKTIYQDSGCLGHNYSTLFEIIVDNQHPKPFDITIKPQPDEYDGTYLIKNSEFYITANITDNRCNDDKASGIDNTSLRIIIDNTFNNIIKDFKLNALNDISCCDSYHINHRVIGLEDGLYSFKFEGKDIAGNEIEDDWHLFRVDTENPAIRLELISNEGFGDDILAKVIVEDWGSEISEIHVDFGDSTIINNTFDPPKYKEVIEHRYSQCEAKSKDKQYTISAQAIDKLGNITSTLNVDGEELEEFTFTLKQMKKLSYPVGFVANRAANTVTAFSLDPCDDAGKAIAQIPVGDTPFGIDGREDGRIYVTNSRDGTLSVIDTNYDPDNDTFEFGEVPGSPFPLDGINPGYIVLTPDGSRAYIADRTSGIIKTINLVYWTDFLNPKNQYVAIEPHSDLSKYNKIYEIPIDLPERGNIEDINIDPAGRRLYVLVKDGNNLHANGGWIVVIDIEYVITQHSYPNWSPESFHNPDFFPKVYLDRMGAGPLNEPSDIAFSPDGDLVYVTGDGTTELITQTLNWMDGTGGILVLDPQAIDDPSWNISEKSIIIDYIRPEIIDSQADIFFFRAPRLGYSSYLGYGGGVGSSSMFIMQSAYNALASTLDKIIYKFPVDIDGARSISISPDGRRGYISFFETNNIGIIDLPVSLDEPSGFSIDNYPENIGIYASTEAILPSLDLKNPDPPGWDRFPDETLISRDGYFLIISNRGQDEDRVTIIDTRKMDHIIGLLNNSQLDCQPPSDYPYKVAGDCNKLSLDDLKKYPLDNLPTPYSDDIFGGLSEFILNNQGIDNPEGISIIPSYDSDDDQEYGGLSDLVEAKNRFNSLLNLPPSLIPSSLISSDKYNIISPLKKDRYIHSQAINRPWGDDNNNYKEEYKKEDPMEEGKLINGVLLPTEGIGYRHDYGYDPYNSDNAGTLQLINLLEKVGRKWLRKHPDGPRIIYCDLSRPGGGQFMEIGPEGGLEQDMFQRHAAHQNGLDADVRYMRSDLTENRFDFVLSNVPGEERNNTNENIGEYNVELSTELINLFLEDEDVEMVVVDPRVKQMAEDKGLFFLNDFKLIIRGEIDGLKEGSRRDHDDHFSIRITQIINHPPFANAGPDVEYCAGEKASLDGSDSFDPDDNFLTYKWRQIDQVDTDEILIFSEPVIVEGSPFLSFNTSIDFKSQDLFFGLIVYDGEFESEQEDIVKIHINGRPKANAGNDQIVNAGEVVTLDGSLSEDLDEDELNYLWTQITGPAVLQSSAGQVITFEAPSDLYEEITLTFILIVSDHCNESLPDEVTIIVMPQNHRPIADCGYNQTFYSETLPDQITLDGSNSYDTDGDPITYKWTQIAGPSVTLSDSTSMIPTFTPISEEALLSFNLIVNDGELDSAPCTVNIFIIKEPGSTGVPSAIVINEIVTDPKQDWSSVGFNGSPEPGGIVDPNDQLIEIYNNSSESIDLTGWSIIMKDNSTTRHYIGSGSGVEVYSEGSSQTDLQPDGFLIIGNPEGIMDNDCYIVLLNSQELLIDSIEIGDDYQADGQDGAPEVNENGSSTGLEDESIARIPNGMDTDSDINDFEKSSATPGKFNL